MQQFRTIRAREVEDDLPVFGLNGLGKSGPTKGKKRKKEDGLGLLRARKKKSEEWARLLAGFWPSWVGWLVFFV